MNFNLLFVLYRKYGICTLKTLNPPPPNTINHKNKLKKPSQDFVISEKVKKSRLLRPFLKIYTENNTVHNTLLTI